MYFSFFFFTLLIGSHAYQYENWDYYDFESLQGSYSTKKPNNTSSESSESSESSSEPPIYHDYYHFETLMGWNRNEPIPANVLEYRKKKLASASPTAANVSSILPTFRSSYYDSYNPFGTTQAPTTTTTTTTVPIISTTTPTTTTTIARTTTGSTTPPVASVSTTAITVRRNGRQPTDTGWPLVFSPGRRLSSSSSFRRLLLSFSSLLSPYRISPATSSNPPPPYSSRSPLLSFCPLSSSFHRETTGASQ